MRLICLFVICSIFISCDNSKDLNTSSPLSCASYCKNIIESQTIETSDTGKDHLSFANYGYRGIGQCRGHSLVTQRFNLLSNFDLHGDNCLLDKTLTKECRNKTRATIKEIMKFKLTTINGFENLYEFSKHPFVGLYLKVMIQSISNKYRARIGTVENTYSTMNESIFYELVKRTIKGQRPYIALQGFVGLGHHGVLGSRVSYRDGREVLCARDPNIILPEEELEDCQSYFFLENENIYYSRHKRATIRLSKFQHFSDEDKRMEKFINEHYQTCMERVKGTSACDG